MLWYNLISLLGYLIMKTIKILAVIFSLFFVMPTYAARKNVDVDWTRRGLDVDFPKYKYESRRFRSEYRNAERMPKRLTRQGFRELDKSINRTVSRKIEKFFN
jgi:hypothetical protein